MKYLIHKKVNIIHSLNIFRLPYRTIFGGASSIKTNHFLKVNGMSNMFFGWGGEDDDFSRRYVM
jgi:hypothetical protein